MSAGCFSWCRLLTQWGFRKRTTKVEPDEIQSAILLETNDCTLVENRVMVRKSKEVVPTRTEYVTAGGKQVVRLLQSAAGIIPVPLLSEAIKVAIKIIEICEDASAVEEKVKEVQARVSNLMVVIVAHVTANTKEGSEPVVEAAKGIEEDIEGLLRTLKTISSNLKEISEQNRWLTAFLEGPNMRSLQDCMDQLSKALEKFKLANDLRDSELLQELQTRLEKMNNRVNDISKDVKYVVAGVNNINEKMDEFHDVMSRLKQPTADSVVRQQMPLKPEIFYGRDGIVEEIVQWFMNEDTSHVCILGPGGMGKTSVSLAVVESSRIKEQFPQGNIFWVPCIGATSATLLLEILYIQLGIPRDKQVTLKRILSELNMLKNRCLILLDNFETPWNAPNGTQKQAEDILRELAQLRHVAIFVTMRRTYPPCNKAIKWQSKNIQPTDEESCFRIFHEINPSSNCDPDLDSLLRALGHMPFAVTLMANLAEDGHSTPKELLDAWFESGPDILSDNPEQSMNRCISLSVDSDFVKRNPNAILLLTILSLLPAGTTKENLSWWAPTLKESMIPSAVATLSKAALLVENQQQDSNSPVLFVIPVVQSFMQHDQIAGKDRITDEQWKQIHSSCCKYVLDHACRYCDSTFPVNSKALAAEDTNIQSILFSKTQTTNITMEALTAFNWHRYDTKPSSEIANLVMIAAKASCMERYIASAVWCLGATYYAISEFERAYNLVQEACNLFNALSSDDYKLQQLSGRCAINLVECARFSSLDKSEAITLAIDVEKKCANLSDDVIHGSSLIALGTSLYDGQRWQEGLFYFNHARVMMKALGNTYYLAVACLNIARVHHHESRLVEALDAIQEAWVHSEISNRLYIQAIISIDFGRILFAANRDMEAREHIELALKKASHIESHNLVAQALEYMGYGYLRQGDYRNAYDAYEAAVDKYVYIGWEPTFLVTNMERIVEKQKNPDKVVGFFRPHRDLELDYSPFYPPVQGSAINVPISCS